MKIEQVPVEKLIKDPANARKHNQKNIEAIKGSLLKFGQQKPIVINDKNIVIAGNGTLEAARLLGWKDISVVITDLKGSELAAFGIADNRTAELAEWDDAVLADILKSLKDEDFNLSEIGFKEADLDKILNIESEGKTEPDEVPEVPEEPKSKAGEVYQCGRHRVLCGDSANDKNFSKLFSDKKPVVIFTDPPYGVSIGAKNRMLNSFQKSGRNLTDIESDNLKPEDLKKILDSVFVNVKKYIAEDCSVFVCSPQGGGLGMMMMMMMKDCGLEVRHVLNWIKNSPTFSMGRLDYDYQHEPIFFTWGKKHKKIMGGEFKTSLWAVNKPRECKEHPTMKPVELPVNAILNHSDLNDLVADPFLGSGTTMIAAEKTNRICYGIELSPNYVDVIRKRWAEFVHGKGCDWELLTPCTS